MNRIEIRETLDRVQILAAEVDAHVPDRPIVTDFRSDLAGLLVVMTCATYETCVKNILYSYAGRHSPLFKVYVENKYEKINSKIEISDLHTYAKTFHSDLGKKFKESLNAKSEKYLLKANKDIKQSYTQLLKWRHSFAHTGARVTTVEEVLQHHSYAKRVLFIFSDSLRDFLA